MQTTFYPTQDRPRLRRTAFDFVGLWLLLALLAALSLPAAWQFWHANRVFTGVSIGGVPVEGHFDLASSKIVLAEGQPVIGWPIMGMAHLMVCDSPADPLPLSVAQYAVRLAGQGALETFGVTPLPEPIRVQTFGPLKVIAAAPTE